MIKLKKNTTANLEIKDRKKIIECMKANGVLKEDVVDCSDEDILNFIIFSTINAIDNHKLP